MPIFISNSFGCSSDNRAWPRCRSMRNFNFSFRVFMSLPICNFHKVRTRLKDDYYPITYPRLLNDMNIRAANNSCRIMTQNLASARLPTASILGFPFSFNDASQNFSPTSHVHSAPSNMRCWFVVHLDSVFRIRNRRRFYWLMCR